MYSVCRVERHLGSYGAMNPNPRLQEWCAGLETNEAAARPSPLPPSDTNVLGKEIRTFGVGI